MPPDSLAQAKQVFKDSLVANVEQAVKLKDEKKWQDNILWPVVSGLILTFLIYLFASLWKRVLESRRRKSTLVSFSSDSLTRAENYFVENDFLVSDIDGEKKNIIRANSLAFFVKNILSDEYGFYFLTAPTGVGKTTFLLNVYRAYYKKRRKRNLYLGRAHDPVFRSVIDQVISQGKASSTILLIDALDEYDLRVSSVDDYWIGFMKDWDIYKHKLAQFKKVIVSVREQFLHFPEIERVKVPLREGVSICQQILLLPFETELQREKYIERRYSDKSLSDRDNLKWLAAKFDQWNLQFIQLPIILNFLEDIYSAYEEHKLKNITVDPRFFTLFNVLQIIEKSWIAREVRTKGFDNRQVVVFRNFCINLAGKIATEGVHGRIAASSLIELENEKKIIHEFQSVSDRSLLIRDKAYTAGEDQYGFIHRYFLEYFLILYLIERPNVVTNISFDNYPFVVRMLTAFKWSELKKTAIPFDSQLEWPISFSAPMLIQWVNWIKGVFYNKQCEEILSKTCDFYSIIGEFDPEWHRAFPPAYGIVIDNENFWDKDQNRPIESMLDAVSILRPAIREVNLYEISFTNEYASFFVGISSLDKLILYDSNITLVGLSHFRFSAENLKTLDICNSELGDQALVLFQNANQLESLNIQDSCITTAGLKMLSKSAGTLSFLRMPGNSIDDEGLKMFSGQRNISGAILCDNAITGTGLRYLGASFQNMKVLDISNLKLGDEDFNGLSSFEDLHLFLADNVPVTGKTINLLRPCVSVLEQLSLNNTKVDDQSLSIFREATLLSSLDLSKTAITGSSLEYFVNNKEMKYLHLSSMNNFDLSNLVFCRVYHKLIYLDISNMDLSEEHLINFRNCQNTLKSLFINGNRKITSLRFAIDCPELVEITIDTTTQFKESEIAILKGRGIKIIIPEQ